MDKDMVNRVEGEKDALNLGNIIYQFLNFISS